MAVFGDVFTETAAVAGAALLRQPPIAASGSSRPLTSGGGAHKVEAAIVPHDGVMCRALHIVVALALLAGQWALIAHQLDLRAHSPGHHCEVCVAAAPCAGTVPEVGWAALPEGVTPQASPLTDLRGGTVRVTLPPARAPPDLLV
jgi:hypothetical protein